jgi:protein-S-isoprenylcysteine O-methyltransferase Ste14
VYAASLILTGVGAKCLLKRATAEDVFKEANWVLAVSLLVAFVCLNVFAVLHHKKHIKDTISAWGTNLTWINIRGLVLILLSIFGFISIALVGMRPAHTLVSDYIPIL